MDPMTMAMLAKTAASFIGNMKDKKQGNPTEPSTSASGMAGMGIGALQGIQANKLKKESESFFPEYVDPNQASFLAELGQKRKSIETGADIEEALQNIGTTTAGTQDAITQSTGGDVGGTVQALLQSQRVGQQGVNQALAQGQQRQMQYTGLYQDMLNRIAETKMQLQLQRSQQKLAEWGRMAQDSKRNFMAGLAKSLPISDGLGSDSTNNISSEQQQGMNWLNPQQEPSITGNEAYGHTPTMMSGASPEPSIDLSVLNAGAL